MINATLGLGESLVSGQVIPDQYIVDSASGRILAQAIGEKASSLLCNEHGGGTRLVENDAATRRLAALSTQEVDDLVVSARCILALYDNEPQDIEWAIDDRLRILQSRPVMSDDSEFSRNTIILLFLLKMYIYNNIDYVIVSS